MREDDGLSLTPSADSLGKEKLVHACAGHTFHPPTLLANLEAEGNTSVNKSVYAAGPGPEAHPPEPSPAHPAPRVLN